MSQPEASIRAPRGNTRTARGWIQEAAKRMLMNNLDPDVAEKPAELIVYGGRGKAARNWECFHKIVETLDRLENNQTLLIQSGKPVAVLETQRLAPRVLGSAPWTPRDSARSWSAYAPATRRSTKRSPS